MHLSPDTGRWLDFGCNVCGSRNTLEAAEFHREKSFCWQCGSNARFRGLISALADCLGIDPTLALCDWPAMPSVKGLGMSDWPGYAQALATRFNYVNTFYDREPRFDVLKPDARDVGAYDFVMSSDVLEHVLPPMERAFANVHSLLKPGGWLVLTVPYTPADDTLEHYANIAGFASTRLDGKPLVVWKDTAGKLLVDGHPTYHGGEGATLELRIFGRTALLRLLEQAGFSRIEVMDQPRLSCGYYWPELDGPTEASPKFEAYVIKAQRT